MLLLLKKPRSEGHDFFLNLNHCRKSNSDFNSKRERERERAKNKEANRFDIKDQDTCPVLKRIKRICQNI